MADPFIDTNILIRFLTRDDPAKQARATALFTRIEKREVTVFVSGLVIAEAVYVLSSPRLYNLPRHQVCGLLNPLVRLPAFKVRNKRAVMQALDLYLNNSLDFEDAFIVVSMAQARSGLLYSFDRGFDQVLGIQRVEP